jgi:hypothetical protein
MLRLFQLAVCYLGTKTWTKTLTDTIYDFGWLVLQDLNYL